MILRIKVWPTPELAKTTFVSNGSVLEHRTATLDLRSFPAVANLTSFARTLLWDDFFSVDPDAYSKVVSLTTGNIASFSEDKVALSEWINHLFKQKLESLNNEWAQAEKAKIEASNAEDCGF